MELLTSWGISSFRMWRGPSRFRVAFQVVNGGLSGVARTIFAVEECAKSGRNGFAGPRDEIFLSPEIACSH